MTIDVAGCSGADVTLVGGGALTIVVALLAMTAGAQIRPLSRHRRLLDMVALVPEWRFYAQASIGSAADYARDTHLVVRDRDKVGQVGGWRPVLWREERRFHHAFWNPRRRRDDLIFSMADDLAGASAINPGEYVQQSIRYLILLRFCLETPMDLDAVEARQFAIVHTMGRGSRDISVDFLSAWHRP